MTDKTAESNDVMEACRCWSKNVHVGPVAAAHAQADPLEKIIAGTVPSAIASRVAANPLFAGQA